MKKLSFYFVLFVGLLLGIILYQAPLLQAIAPPQSTTIVSGQSNNKSEDEASAPKPSFDEAIENFEALPGLFTLYRHKEDGQILLEIKPEQLNKNYLATITLASGIGEQGFYSGSSMESFLFYFRRVNKNVLFTVRNVNFRANPNDPQRRSVERSFSDSVLYSLKIISIHPQRRTILVDLGELLLKDLAGLKSWLKNALDVSYELDASKSYFGTTKGFPLNVEIDAIYGFTLSDDEDKPNLLTLPDSRALSLRVHYSFSQLPDNNYRPRLADERVGYFHTVYKDFSNHNQREPFVRYVNRWHLEKQNPKETISPPKNPIVFWIENTVPLEYRDAIREGVMMWNQAFEKAGFKDALSVQQMPDNATWNPADVRYNTIRWINSLDAAFAQGPARVNPMNGEILDADIIVDANLVRSQQQDYRTFVEKQRSSNASLTKPPCDWSQASNQFTIGEIALPLVQNQPNEIKEFIHQFLRWVVAHEVGHTLGLRHNFRASTLLKPEELNNRNITRTKGMVSSVMDYVPINLAPIGTLQGDYFPVVVGPYDEWAIEYGYKPSTATTTLAEKPFLQQITNRQANHPELSYAPDEDLFFDLDPTVNRYDLSSDPLSYSQLQLDNARILWQHFERHPPSADEAYSELTKRFDEVMSYYRRQLNFITKYIGGQSFYRDRPNPQNQRLPFVPVPISKQREALTALQKYVFAADAFNFPPELLNKLAPSRWDDFGNELIEDRLDYPIHDRIFSFQSYILSTLLSGDRISRLRDLELKAAPGEALTIPELFNTLQAGIWTELEPAVKISSLRRALQREHLRLLIGMVLRRESVPEDARSLAWSKLRQLRSQIERTLRRQGKNLDEYTIAHLAETRDRITKVLDAPLQSKRLNS